MKRERLWVICGLLLPLILVAVACSQAATPAPKPTPSPTAAQSPTSTQQPTTKTTSPAAKTPTPTAKPTTTTAAGGVSFAGKAITIVVPVNAGTGSDIMSRTYARYLTKYLPGNPSILTRNMPGGGATIGANYVTTAKPDGLTLLATTGGVVVGQLLGISAAKYDLLKMRLIVSTSAGGAVTARPNVVDKPENILKAKGMIFGSGAVSTSSYLFVTAKEFLDFPVEKVIMGYSSSSDYRRAFVSGEINAMGDSWTSYKETIAPLVAKKEAVTLYVNGILDSKGDLVRAPEEATDVPTVKELYEKLYNKPPSGIAWDAYKGVIAATRTYDSAIYTSPGTPENIVRAYWTAAEAMLKDPAFKRESDTLLGAGNPMRSGEALDKSFQLNFTIKPEIREWLRTTLPRYSMVVE